MSQPATLAARPPASLHVGTALMLAFAVVVSLALSMTPWGRYVLYPFKLFTTWVHESGHALMAELVGGDVQRMTIEPDTSGLTRSLLPPSRVAQGFVAMSGYLGATLFGCLLLVATRLRGLAHRIIWLLGACMLASLVLWVRNAFGAAVVLGLGAALVGLGRHGRGPVAQFLLSLLAVQVGLNAFFDIRVLFELEPGTHSDAASMESLFLVPAPFWAALWMATSALMVGATLWATRERSPVRPPASISRVR